MLHNLGRLRCYFGGSREHWQIRTDVRNTCSCMEFARLSHGAYFPRKDGHLSIARRTKARGDLTQEISWEVRVKRARTAQVEPCPLLLQHFHVRYIVTPCTIEPFHRLDR
mmetsp:Transcript_6847/g.24392  ORF Transcript_6847/g.24392 Transcript_6847/m.24392 type:complete len:110 (+) Transcript_6847:440-769(+)